MEIIKLQELTELKEKENLPKVPELVQKYLDTKKYKPKGKHFRIVINSYHDLNTGAGIAYSNELLIKKKDGDKWVKAYSTGMIEYRGAFAHSIDNWDLSFSDPTIFEESKNEVTYALRTGEGNVKIYRFSEERPENLVIFNTRDYQKTQERIKLLQKVLDNSEAFRSYVEKGLRHRWRTASKIEAISWEYDCYVFDATGDNLKSGNNDNAIKKSEIVVLLAKHYDRDADSLVDAYRIYVWMKGKGLGVTDVYPTGSCHPKTRFYTIKLRFNKVILTNFKQGSLNLSVSVKNHASYWTPRTHPIPTLNPSWNETRNFRVQWGGLEPTDFERKVEKAMEHMTQSYQHNHPLYKPTRITESVIDAKRKIAAWILFEQIDTDRCTADGEGWLGDQFRYSLWKKKGGQKPVQLYESHAYIRPRTKSELTGTRGRDCTIKNLRIEDGIIKVTHSKDKKVEEQEWEEITFSLQS